MRVTIIADASHCPDTGKAGYGFWIACGRGKRGGDGIMRVDAVNSIAAEMMALNNALHVARKVGLIEEGDELLLQTDCQAAIDAFEFKRRNITKQEEGLVEWFTLFTLDNKVMATFKHVKGHTNNEAARFVTNSICDRKARANMRLARDKYRINKIKEFLND